MQYYFITFTFSGLMNLPFPNKKITVVAVKTFVPSDKINFKAK